MKKDRDYYGRVLSCLMFGHPGRYKDHHMDRIMAETETPQLIDEFKGKLVGILQPHYDASNGNASSSPAQEAFTPGITTREGDIAVPESPETSTGGDDAPGNSDELRPGEIPSASAPAPAAPQPPITSRTESLPNGRAGQPYAVVLDDVLSGLPAGLDLTLDDDGGTGLTLTGARELQGTPTTSGTAQLQLTGRDAHGEDALRLTLKLALIPSSRDLWKDRPSNPKAPYAKPDHDVDRLDFGQGWHMAMGSLRGRSHAHRGGQRDDHGVIARTDSGWNLLLVGDGAGSCEFSRQGSLLATTTARDSLINALGGENGAGLETAALDWWASGDTSRMPQQLTRALHDTVITAVHKGYLSISDEAESSGRPVKAFSTTLLLALHKATPQGHLVVTFGIGDGAIAALSDGGQARLMNSADSGQHAGQTRFLDGQLFQDSQGLYQRLKAQVFDSLDALVLATDGVTDPKFVSDNDMHEPASWWALYDELAPALPGTDATGQPDPLLEYLNFFIERHHDDRTVAVLYRDSSAGLDDAIVQDPSVAEPVVAPAPVPETDRPAEEPTDDSRAVQDDATAQDRPIAEPADGDEAEPADGSVDAPAPEADRPVEAPKEVSGAAHVDATAQDQPITEPADDGGEPAPAPAADRSDEEPKDE